MAAKLYFPNQRIANVLVAGIIILLKTIVYAQDAQMY